ncbi:MAG: SDR family oxidoreductase [Chloroflexi bacterium]|nr:SDR family oxidoreductase [Chloroflexota bacterium]
MTEQKVAIISGGGSGIGKAIALALAEQGCQVVIMGRSAEPLGAVAQAQPGIAVQQVDVSQRRSVANAIEAVVEQFGQIDVLVNNAGFIEGIAATAPLDEAEAIWEREMASNLKGAFLMAVAVAPQLTRPGGRIINISSIAAYTGGSRGGVLGYAAAKAGLHGLTVALARDLGSGGICVNAVVPGLITGTNFFGGPLPDERVTWVAEQVPLGRAGQPNDVAAVVAFLASEGASYITGEIINVNGGWLFGR